LAHDYVILRGSVVKTKSSSGRCANG